MQPIEYLFKDHLFRLRLRAYYDMPKFNDDHDLATRYRMLNDIALTYGLFVATLNDITFVFADVGTHVISVTRYKVDEYEMQSTAVFYSENFIIYLLPELPKEVNDVLVKYREDAPTGRQEEDKALLH